MNVPKYNRTAWNRESNAGSRWSTPVSSDEIAVAKRGEWQVILTPNKSVPRAWFGDIRGKRILCLASGGGQQAPVLAAAGAQVTSFDNSDEQLAKDRLVADRDSLALHTVRGDMADLSEFADQSFDLIFHPVANVFCEDIGPVWKECYRVLRWGGRLLAGFMNPMFFLFDHDEAEKSGVLQVKYPVPFSDLQSLPEEQRQKLLKEESPICFGHTLEQQLGGQLAVGFVICDLYEDGWDDQATPLNKFADVYLATLAKKVQLEPQGGTTVT